MLDNLHNMCNLLTARLHATSDAEDADETRAAFLACENADNALRSTVFKLAAGKTIQEE
uniref:RNA polymerase n=1 Tax=Mesocestoides corti TaxID=53468 RepID=A0A5K3FNY1_MESCO